MPESLSRDDRTTGEIDWPAFADRTAPAARERTSKYSITQTKAINRLEKELLDRVGADDWRLSTAAAHRKRDGKPYADANPDDPGVVVRWTKDGDQYCVACDRYTDIRDNARTIGLYVEEKRKMSDRPVRTGQDEFATARLPPGDGEEEPIVAGAVDDGLDQEPHEVLGVSEDAPEPVIKGAFRELAKEGHGDQGADERYDVAELKEARGEMLEEDDG